MEDHSLPLCSATALQDKSTTETTEDFRRGANLIILTIPTFAVQEKQRQPRTGLQRVGKEILEMLEVHLASMTDEI